MVAFDSGDRAVLELAPAKTFGAAALGAVIDFAGAAAIASDAAVRAPALTMIVRL